jgi:hypothetical protein
VGGLPQAYDSNMLRQLFAPHAEVVHSAVITDPGSNLSKGYGFIHIPDPAKVRHVGDSVTVSAHVDRDPVHVTKRSPHALHLLLCAASCSCLLC